MTSRGDLRWLSLLFVLSACAQSLPTPPVDPSPSPAARIFALRLRASDALSRGDYKTCSALLAEAAPLRPRPSGRAAVSRARCFAAGGEDEAAMTMLREAMPLKFRDCDLLRDGREFARLRGRADWAPIMQSCAANHAEYRRGINLELEALLKSDQADRGPGGVQGGLLDARDSFRLRRVKEIFKSGGVRSAADHFAAAMIFQHGTWVDDYRRAHELAVKAATLDPEDIEARWLAAASKDRELVARGKRQRYGTQFRTAPGGKMDFFPVDPSVTDAERAEWEVPPLLYKRDLEKK
jgi:hypothetical protein